MNIHLSHLHDVPVGTVAGNPANCVGEMPGGNWAIWFR